MQAAVRVPPAHNYGDPLAGLKQTMASNLRRLMRENGNLKAKDLANILGVSPSIVTLWRNGDRFPYPENIEAICAHFKIPFIELFRTDKDPNPIGNLDPETAIKLLARALDWEARPRSPEGKKKSP